METFIERECKLSEAEPPLYQFYAQACGADEPFTSFQYDQAAIFTSCRYFFGLHNIKSIQHKVLILARGYFICIGSGSGFLSALIKLYLHPLHPYIHWIDGWME